VKLLGKMDLEQEEAHIKEIFGKEYELEFSDMVQNIGSLDKNIDSVSVLTNIA